MRINVYSQELTNEVSLVEKESDGANDDGTPVVYSAVRLYLHSSPMLHHGGDGEDDDRSAITIWLPKSKKRRMALAKTLRNMATMAENARSETGLD